MQKLRGADGIVENFYEGSFRVRPSDAILKDLTSTYYKQTVFTGCANGQSNQYNLFFYRRQCSNFSVIILSTDLELEFFFTIIGTTEVLGEEIF